MKIILLTGKKGTGKTTTLNLVYDQLLQQMKQKKLTLPTRRQLGGCRRDFECFPMKYNGKTVAVVSMGDILYQIGQSMAKYSGAADVLVIAHSRGGKIKNAFPNSLLACY